MREKKAERCAQAKAGLFAAHAIILAYNVYVHYITYLIWVIVRVITIKCNFVIVTAIICSRPHALLPMVLAV
jgi:hypothetical protein